MQISRRHVLQLASGAACLSACPGLGWAVASYPSRPVQVMVGVAAGGSSSVLARLMADWLSERLGQPFVVVNRPGAGTNIATEAVVKSPPDGYTLLMVTPANAINASLYDKLNFVFLRDIVPVAGMMRVPNVMEVNPSLPVKTVPEFIAYAKANPGKINFGSAGLATITQLYGEMFNIEAGVKMVHVPYKGSAPAYQDLLANQVDMMFDNIPGPLGLMRGGKVKGIAVTSSQRHPSAPASTENSHS
jgi:tripartite-type tricarboxylate transporter receptor subunit TctC